MQNAQNATRTTDAARAVSTTGATGATGATGTTGTTEAGTAAGLDGAQETRVGVSVVVPVYNEEQSLRPLYHALTAALERLGQSYEIVFVDDGSRDGSFSTLTALHEQDQHVRVIRFRRNFGKTPALVAGFSHVRGDIVFTMDADLQDDPNEMAKFIAKLDEGYDLVSGWKYPRHDPITKTFPSFFFNRMVSVATGVRLHDINCGFKAYRREVRSEEHTSELQSHVNLVCRLLL